MAVPWIGHAGPASVSDEITWSMVDWAPVYIVDKSDAPTGAAELGEGGADHILRAVIAHLPEYHHRFIVSNSSRWWSSAAAGEHMCNASSLLTSERLKVAYFTPAITLPPVGVIGMRKRFEGIARPGESVSLAELVANPHLSGVVEPLRSYGAGLDKILASGSKGNLAVEALPRDGKALQLLEAGRMDYMIEYPFVVQYQMRRLNVTSPIDFHPIRELKEEPVSYIACSRTEWGKRAITAIDRAMREVADEPEVRTSFTRWLPPEVRPAEQQRTDHYLDERATHALIY